jgi:hypothetical protein
MAEMKISEGVSLLQYPWRMTAFKLFLLGLILFATMGVLGRIWTNPRIGAAVAMSISGLLVVFIFYQFWKLRFDLRNSIEILFCTKPVVEIGSEGIVLKWKNRSVKYDWHAVKENARTVFGEGKSRYELMLFLKDWRSIEILDDSEWNKFNLIKQWSKGLNLNEEIDYCEIDRLK